MYVVVSIMITVQDAFRRFLLAEGDGGDYRCNKIVYVTADRKRNQGGDIMTLSRARLLGQYRPSTEAAEKTYRRRSWRDFYDETTGRNYRIHIDLILSVNDLDIA